MQITEADDRYEAVFNKKTLYFLKEDVLILPLENITLEELSQWFVDNLIRDQSFLNQHEISAIKIKVFNGPEHAAIAEYAK